jgi:hypothetical protein
MLYGRQKRRARLAAGRREPMAADAESVARMV